MSDILMPLSRTLAIQSCYHQDNTPPHVSSPPAVGTNSTLTHVLQGHQKIRCLLYSPNISEQENEPLFPVLDPSFCLQPFSPWGQNSNTFISGLGHSSGPARWFFHSPQFKPEAWPGRRREGEEQLESRALCLSVCPSSWEKGRWCRPLSRTSGTTPGGFLGPGSSLNIIYFSLTLSWRKRRERIWQKGERDRDKEDIVKFLWKEKLLFGVICWSLNMTSFMCEIEIIEIFL